MHEYVIHVDTKLDILLQWCGQNFISKGLELGFLANKDPWSSLIIRAWSDHVTSQSLITKKYKILPLVLLFAIREYFTFFLQFLFDKNRKKNLTYDKIEMCV